jgi:RNA polymerase sigma-70 factor, ECF subfamily
VLSWSGGSSTCHGKAVMDQGLERHLEGAPALRRAAEAGRQAWPIVSLAEDVLAAYVDRLSIPPAALAEHGADVYLAAACAAHVPEALTAFERTFLAEVERYVRRMALSRDMVDEVRQLLRIRMLGPEARIGRYAGGTQLRNWIRLASVRLALDLIAAAARQPTVADFAELAEQLVSDDAPEAQALRARYRTMVQTALEEGLQSLPERDKAVLQFHVLEGLNLDGIGTIYRVHRATVARWLVDIRRRVFAVVRQRLALQLDASPSELASLVALVRDDLHASLSRLLRK